MMDYFKKIILKRSDSYNFYKNSYNKLVAINKKNTLLLREKQDQLDHEIIKLKKINDKLSYLESENANLNARITEYNKINDMINNLETQNQQLNNTIKSLESENSNLNSKMTEYNKIREKISNLETQNKQLNDKLTTINKQNEILLNNNETYLEKIQYLQKHAEYNNIKLDGQYDKLEFLLSNKNSQMLETNQFNNKQYLMTLIIPVYNSQNYIEKCFISILNQSIFNKIEIIFIDDCSTDESMNKIMELKNNYENIKILKTDKNSLYGGRPRNKGLNYITTDYVLFLDSDDILMENVCEILLNKIIEHDADIVFGTHVVKTISEQDKENYEIKHMIVPQLWKYYKESEELIINDIRDYPSIMRSFSPTNKLFNVNFIKENQITFPEYIPAEDSYFIFKAIINSKKTIFIPHCIFEHVLTRNTINDMSVSFRSDQTTRMGRLKSYNMMYKLSKENYIEDIFIENLLYDKITYVLRTNVFNQKITYKEYVEFFDGGYELFKALLDNNISSGEYTELFKKIVDKDYENAIELCKTFNYL